MTPEKENLSVRIVEAAVAWRRAQKDVTVKLPVVDALKTAFLTLLDEYIGENP